MAESELSQILMKQLNKVGHAIRVENVAENGTPDVEYAFERAQGWIETKEAKGSYLYFEKFQLPWFRKRLRATHGRNLWVLAKVGKSVNLYHPSTILAAGHEPYRKWVRVKTSDLQPHYASGNQAVNWAEIIAILAHE